MTLVLNRIDDRLIHGQVVVGWGQPLDVRFTVLVDDAVAESDSEKELYRMGVPPEMEVRFHSAIEAAPLLDTYRTEPHPGILLTGDIATMRELVVHGGVREVNIGGIHHRAGDARTCATSSSRRTSSAPCATSPPSARSSRPRTFPPRARSPSRRCSPTARRRRERASAILPARRHPRPGRRLLPAMMISRPLVGATVAGAFVGDTITGLLVGVTLELIALATLPFGASRYPEWGSAAVVGGAIAAALRTHPAGRSPLACSRRSPPRG